MHLPFGDRNNTSFSVWIRIEIYVMYARSSGNVDDVVKVDTVRLVKCKGKPVLPRKQAADRKYIKLDFCFTFFGKSYFRYFFHVEHLYFNWTERTSAPGAE